MRISIPKKSSAELRPCITINWLDDDVGRVLFNGEPTDYVIGKTMSHFRMGIHVHAGDSVEWKLRFSTTEAALDRLAGLLVR